MSYKEANNIEFNLGIIGLTLVAFTITIVSSFIAHLIKKIIPKYSRMIIGA
jgi:hypothetical protein